MNLNQLNQKIKYHNDKLDGLSDELVVALKDYQREYERLLLKTNFDTYNGRLKPTISNYNKAQSLDPMKALGFNKLTMQYSKIQTLSAKVGFDFAKSIGVKTSLGMNDVTQLEILKKLDFDLMYNTGLKLDNLVKKELVNNIALGKDYNQSVEDIGTSLLGMGERGGELSRYADTYMRDSLFAISGTIVKEIYLDAGYTEFEYAGPMDNKTRPFCEEHYGNIYTLEQIEKFPEENGSGLDPFIFPGGYGCRHSLIGVPGSEVM